MRTLTAVAIGLAIGVGGIITLRLTAGEADREMQREIVRAEVMERLVTDEWLNCIRGGGGIDREHDYACFEADAPPAGPVLTRGRP